MFYHGIPAKYIREHYPILSARKSAMEKTGDSLADRLHLLQQFGVEPVHLLEERGDYDQERCLIECRQFGDVVFAFSYLPLPVWQLSKHEVGVSILDLRKAVAIFTPIEHKEMLFDMFPNKNIFVD
ncbi:hypothetical protein [Brevibacillus daliensis]|uniref:hypothetical protein n=1 Tax=Brevibacillus daliensis TaxID=2892995 RepID=UPI001E404038|nr:hypothetical protein [Brevibacillus daliensis]